MKKFQLKFREVNRDIFAAIKSGKKKVETRAATVRYQNIKAGDAVELVCGKDRFEKKIKSAKIYKSAADLLKKHKPKDINPKTETREELEKMFYSFHGYREKIKKHGIAAWELE